MRSWALGILAAVLVHLVILLFGGIFFLGGDAERPAADIEDVQIVDSAEESPDEKPTEPEVPLEEKEAEELEAPEDAAPDMRQLFDAQVEAPSPGEPAALAALSLSALEGALGSGGSGGESFGLGFNLTSGGRIGGVGAPGKELAEEMVFSLSELDVRPRALFQSAPTYPSELRSKKIEGLVHVLFVVDVEGRVTDPKIEASSRPEFEVPALEAVRRWKFEPAMRSGKKVAARMRVPIRFAVTG